VIFDCAARGDSQSHSEYARRMFDWPLVAVDAGRQVDVERFFEATSADVHGRDQWSRPAEDLSDDQPSRSVQATPTETQRRTLVAAMGDYLHLFDYRGRRVTRRDLDWDAWGDWQAELNSRLRAAIAFLYGNFVRGVRRVVVDGIEPADVPGDSIQFHLLEYVYHQIVRKDPQWVARDLFREAYRRHADEVSRHLYDPAQIGCLVLCTSHETMLDDLISRPLAEGDVLSNANTLIYMGKVRESDRIGRALYVAKHRGSACEERIVPYRIDDRGLSIDL
jgi:hypothetical protein